MAEIAQLTTASSTENLRLPWLDWPVLAETLEIAALVRCTPVAAAPTDHRSDTHGVHGVLVAEFNQQTAADRLAYLLGRLKLTVVRETTVAGLRRRYQLHRLYVPVYQRAAYGALMTAAWNQGRTALLDPAATGGSSARQLWRPRLAEALWRSVLTAAGRHLHKNILGVRVADPDLAAMLIRSAQLLGARAALLRRSGCFLVSVPTGPDAQRLLAAVRSADQFDVAV
ncbi:hypothetical protein BDK92_6873 [Micromonospora pisi]|uniref:Uncharacterized protein n=1 Tax=Micromonospora pisi TaxID=589240 RepID=A0A495JVT4_9ACTN|nr:hypothetical protein [Micromonospora pisi]RKR92432.1 hypothetical protein BDK92_6873 [Micromonospora pisi]